MQLGVATLKLYVFLLCKSEYLKIAEHLSTHVFQLLSTLAYKTLLFHFYIPNSSL
jgi:hypothetical protein